MQLSFATSPKTLSWLQHDLRTDERVVRWLLVKKDALPPLPKLKELRRLESEMCVARGAARAHPKSDSRLPPFLWAARHYCRVQNGLAPSCWGVGRLVPPPLYKRRTATLPGRRFVRARGGSNPTWCALCQQRCRARRRSGGAAAASSRRCRCHCVAAADKAVTAARRQ